MWYGVLVCCVLLYEVFCAMIWVCNIGFVDSVCLCFVDFVIMWIYWRKFAFERYFGWVLFGCIALRLFVFVFKV